MSLTRNMLKKWKQKKLLKTAVRILCNGWIVTSRNTYSKFKDQSAVDLLLHLKHDVLKTIQMGIMKINVTFRLMKTALSLNEWRFVSQYLQRRPAPKTGKQAHNHSCQRIPLSSQIVSWGDVVYWLDDHTQTSELWIEIHHDPCSRHVQLGPPSSTASDVSGQGRAVPRFVGWVWLAAAAVTWVHIDHLDITRW